MTGITIVPMGRAVEIVIDGELISAHEGEPLAAVFLRLPDNHTKTMVGSGNARAPYCMMGVCYECLVHIDGIGAVRSCQEMVRAGMKVERQRGLRQFR